MDFTPLYKHAPLGALHFAPSGAFLAHAVGPRLVVRDSENFGISRVWDLKHGGKEWKSVDYIAWNADGLLLAANYAQGLVRVYCPDTVLEAELVGDSNEREWECDIDAGESVAAVRWGPNAQIWVWEEFNLRLTIHSLTTLSTAYLANTKHLPDRGISTHPRVPNRVLVLERRDCKDAISIYSADDVPEERADRDSKVSTYTARTGRTGTARGSLSVAGTTPPNPPNPFPLTPIHRFELVGPSSTTATGNTPANPMLDAWDAQWTPTGSHILVLDSPLNFAVHAYSPDGRCVWSYSPLRHPSDLPLGVRTLAWGSQGRHLALGGYDGRVRIVDSWGWKPVVSWSAEVGRIESGDVEVWKEVVGERGKCKFEKVEARPINVPVAKPEGGVMTTTVSGTLDGKGPTGVPKVGISGVEWNEDGDWIVTRNETTPTTLLIHHVPTLSLHTVLLLRSAPVKPTFNPNPDARTCLAWASSSDVAVYTWDPRYGPEAWEVPSVDGFKVRGVRWNVGTGRSLAVWEADKGGRWCVGFPVDDDAQEVGAEVAEDEEGIEAEQHEVHDDDERVATHHVRIGFQETPNMSHATHLGRKATPQQATPALSEESGSPHTPYEPEGLETSMDRLTVSVAGARKRGTPARGLLGSYVDDEDDEDGASANGLGSEADMSPDASPFAFTASAALKRLGKDTPGKPLKNKLGGAKFFEEREIKVDDDVEKLPGGGYNGLSLGKVRLW